MFSPRPLYRLPQALVLSILLHCAIIGIVAAVLIIPHRAIYDRATYIYLVQAQSGGGGTRVNGPSAHPSSARTKDVPVKPRSKSVGRSHRKLRVVRAGKYLSSPATRDLPHETVATPVASALIWRNSGADEPQKSNPGSAGGTFDSPFSGDQVAQPPALITAPLPNYPEAARLAGLEGEVVLRIIVDQSGAVDPDIQIVKSIPPLNQAAIEAVRKWRFSPGRDHDGHPVRVLLEVPLRFTLRDSG
jgi:TonB family protein